MLHLLWQLQRLVGCCPVWLEATWLHSLWGKLCLIFCFYQYLKRGLQPFRLQVCHLFMAASLFSLLLQQRNRRFTVQRDSFYGQRANLCLKPDSAVRLTLFHYTEYTWKATFPVSAGFSAGLLFITEIQLDCLSES